MLNISDGLNGILGRRECKLVVQMVQLWLVVHLHDDSQLYTSILIGSGIQCLLLGLALGFEWISV